MAKPNPTADKLLSRFSAAVHGGFFSFFGGEVGIL